MFALVRKDNEAVYVHSKLCVVDDTFASIGSANSNPRSFRMDTELDFTWHNSSVSVLRLDLWKEMLGNPSTLRSWRPKQFVVKWNEIAKINTRRPARARKGFVIPFDNNVKGKENPFPITPFI